MADITIEDELAENYRALVAERGYDWETVAAQLERIGDERTAAWARSQTAPAGPKGRKSRAATADTAAQDDSERSDA